MDYINRAAEKLAKEAVETYKSILVTGARQTGKSTMLEALFPDRNPCRPCFYN